MSQIGHGHVPPRKHVPIEGVQATEKVQKLLTLAKDKDVQFFVLTKDEGETWGKVGIKPLTSQYLHTKEGREELQKAIAENRFGLH